MRDILCPNCQKDEYDVIELNGVKVKQCKICGAVYQLYEQEIYSDYLPDSKDEQGNFVKCPKCGSANFRCTADFDVDEYFSWLEWRYRYDFHRFVRRGTFICLDCCFAWDYPLF